MARKRSKSPKKPPPKWGGAGEISWGSAERTRIRYLLEITDETDWPPGWKDEFIKFCVGEGDDEQEVTRALSSS